MSGSKPSENPNFGAASLTGYGVSAAGIVAMLLAYIFPDGDEQQLGVIAAGVVALVSLVVTNVGRYLQAREKIRQQGLATTLGGSGTYRFGAQKFASYGTQSEDEDLVLPADTEGLDPEYTGRTGELKDRLRLEQKELDC